MTLQCVDAAMRRRGTAVPVAVVAMSLRLPGASSSAELWTALMSGADQLSRDSDDGAPPPEPALGLGQNALYIASYGVIRDPCAFDHSRYGMSPNEALHTDPQQRVLLSVADEALFLAGLGHDIRRETGVIAGVGSNSYADVLRRNAEQHPGLDEQSLELGTARDFVAGKVAYRLDLHGPAINIMTACSTGLVGVHLACQSLARYEADAYVVAVSSITYPQRHGYWWMPGTISSADGTCRPFDSRASGTVAADGAVAVVLRRLDDALAADEDVLAVIRGSAVSNDGAKPGFAAVDSRAQELTIRRALAAAGISAERVGYVESHGTATRLGDAVEWAGLTQVFGANRAPVAVGALKGNIGHTREVAGLAGLAKAVLVLGHGVVPPTANFSQAAFELGSSSLASVPRPQPLTATAEPSIAGVSSFGLGGTNAHVVLEVPPPRHAAATAAADEQIILVSSHSRETLAKDVANIRATGSGSAAALASIARHSQRRAHIRGHRHYFTIAQNAIEPGAPVGLAAQDGARTAAAKQPVPVALAFPGLGSACEGMVAELAAEFPAFRQSLNDVVAAAAAIGVDIGDALLARRDQAPKSQFDLAMLVRTATNAVTQGGRHLAETHLAIYAVQIAMSALLAEHGVTPAALVGHSLGEWTAATVAGVVSVEDAVPLIGRRAVLIEEASDGITVAVAAAAQALRDLLPPQVTVAADNSLLSCTVSGPRPQAEELIARLTEAGIGYQVVGNFAFHSAQLEAAAGRLRAEIAGIRFEQARIPIVSSVSGTWLADGDMGAAYWPRHLMAPVQFRSALSAVLARCPLIVQVGPGSIPAWCARQPDARLPVVRTVPSAFEAVSTASFVRQALADIWVRGHDITWPGRGWHGAVAIDVPAMRQEVFDPEPAKSIRPCYPAGPGEGVGSQGIAPGAGTADAAPTLTADPGSAIARMKQIWCRILGVSLVDDADHFFEIGGDSLLGQQLIAAVERDTGIVVPSEVVFASGTLADMAKNIRGYAREGATGDVP